MAHETSDNRLVNTAMNNPFVFDRPVDDTNIMINRAQGLLWIRDNLKDSTSLLLAIEGVPGIGVTTLLNQVKTGGLDLDFVNTYVNLKQIPLDSFTNFLWGFGKTIMQELSYSGLESPPLEKRMLVLRPRQAFQTNFWQPLLMKYSNQHLLLLLDNFNTLGNDQESPESNRAYRQYLYDLLQVNQNSSKVAAILGRHIDDGITELGPFHRSLSFQLANFTEAETSELIRSNHILNFSKSVVDYIYSLTWGHPADIQRLCYAIYEHMEANKLHLVTVADVVSTVRTRLVPGDFKQAIFQQRAKISYLPALASPDSPAEIGLP